MLGLIERKQILRTNGYEGRIGEAPDIVTVRYEPRMETREDLRKLLSGLNEILDE